MAVFWLVVRGKRFKWYQMCQPERLVPDKRFNLHEVGMFDSIKLRKCEKIILNLRVVPTDGQRMMFRAVLRRGGWL